MAYIKVSYRYMDEISNRIMKLNGTVGVIQQQLRSCGYSLDWEIRNASSIQKRLSDMMNELDIHAQSLSNMSGFLSDASRTYRKCDNEIGEFEIIHNTGNIGSVLGATAYKPAVWTELDKWMKYGIGAIAGMAQPIVKWIGNVPLEWISGAAKQIIGSGIIGAAGWGAYILSNSLDGNLMQMKNHSQDELTTVNNPAGSTGRTDSSDSIDIHSTSDNEVTKNPIEFDNIILDDKTLNRIETLNPGIRQDAANFLKDAKSQGIDLIITDGFRSIERQNELYNQGRAGNPGAIVTGARGGESYHNYGLAFDVVEVIDGKAVYASDKWALISEIGKKYGFEWGGDFPNLVDKPHFQKTYGYSFSELMRKINNGEADSSGMLILQNI